jgi:hypothetical protein
MNSEARPTRIPIGPLVASVGAVLLVVSLFLDWYEDRTGFTVFEVLDLLLVAAALAVVAQLAGGMGLIKPAVTPARGLVVTITALVIVGSQVINHPPAAVGGDVDKELGIWLALSGAALMVAGAVLATARISLAVEPRGGERAAPVRVQPGRDDEPTRPLDDPPAGKSGT